METEVLSLKVLEYPEESSEAGAGKNELTMETIHPYRHSIVPIIVLVAAYLTVLIVGVTGNFLVIITVAKTPRMRTVTNYFITNLALADLLVLVFCLPPTLISNIYVHGKMFWRKWKVCFYGTKVKHVWRVGSICFMTWVLFWILYLSLLRLFECHSLSPFWNSDETGYDYDRSPENPDDFILYDDKMETHSSVEFKAIKNYLDKFHEASRSKAEMNQSSLSCQLPRLSSGGKIARRLDREQFLGLYGGNSPNCVDNSYSQKFVIDFESNLIRLDPTQKFWQDALCEYRVISRAEDGPDFIIGLSKRAYRIDQVRTKLRPEDEFIDVRCTSVSKSDSQKIQLTYEDELAQVPVKPSVESLLTHLPLNQQKFERHKHFSILILGLKSVSHQSFVRHMPRSHNYLIKKMGATAFHGYHSIGPDMRENVFSLLTGWRFSQLKNSCLADSDYLDDCPFIWRDYARLGFRTSYAEDAIPWSIFNGQPLKGFSKQPFDYDLRTLTAWIKEGLKAGHDIRNNLTLECHGSRLMFETLLDNMLKTAYTLKEKPYWHMTWSNLLTANANENAKFGDRPLVAALKKLKREKLLKQTIFFILSDHGISFGKSRTTTDQGAFEQRLPLLYIVLPKSFNILFPNATKNLQANSDKLITALDLHSTMKHLISIAIPQPTQHPHTLSLSPVDEALEELHTSSAPIMQIRYDRLLEIEFNSFVDGNSAGESLLMPIPLRRSCEDIGIDKHFCACLVPDPVKPEDVQVKHAVAFVVSYINDRLKAHKQCANLAGGPVKAAWTFKAIQDPAGGKSVGMAPADTAARRIERSFKTLPSTLRHLPVKVLEVNFFTLPGRAEWHAVVRIHRLTKSMTLARIRRVNSPALSQKCTQDKNIHDFCYCLPKPLG